MEDYQAIPRWIGQPRSYTIGSAVAYAAQGLVTAWLGIGNDSLSVLLGTLMAYSPPLRPAGNTSSSGCSRALPTPDRDRTPALLLSVAKASMTNGGLVLIYT